MAFFKDTPQAPSRTVRLNIVPPALHDLLTVLMRHWGIEPLLPGHDILELQADADSEQLTLVPSGGDAEQLALPVKLEELWQALQDHLFDPPRQHYRVPLRLRGALYQGAEQDEFLSISLSDAGIRIEFLRELVREEEVRVELPLDDTRVEICGKVIYCVPTRASGSMIIGLIFTNRQEGLRERLREFLIETTLRQARQQMAHHTFQDALAYLELSPESRTRLATP